MTAPPLDTPAAATAFVGALTDDAKQCLLAALLEEAIALTGGDGAIQIRSSVGKRMGYYVPSDVFAPCPDDSPPPLTPELEAELEESLRNPGVVLSAQEWIAELKRQALGETERRRTLARAELLAETSASSR